VAIQTGTTYVLTGPDGTRAVLNDPSDLDFVGYLDGDGGIKGLESPEVRESADVLVEADGGVHGNFYYGRRPIVLTGWIDPDPDQATSNLRQERLFRASNAMRKDAVLTWTEDGSVARRLVLRRQQQLVIASQRPKTFQLPLVSAQAEIEAAAEQSLVLASGASGYLGFASPTVSPLQSVIAAGGQQFVVNAGTTPAYPILELSGPITNPRVLNNATGQEFRMIYTLAAGETLIADLRRRTVLLGGTVSRYSAVEFPASKWWALKPGNNDIRLNAASAGAGAQVVVRWRDSWI